MSLRALSVKTPHPKTGGSKQQIFICVPPVLETRHVRSRGSQGWAPCRGSRGGSFPPLAASRGSRRLSLGRWPPLRLHVASPLRPCFSSCVSNEDPVMGFRATCIQEEPHLRPFGPSPLQILSFQVTPHSKVLGGDFLGGPVARSPHSQHRRPGFDPWSGK